VQWSDDVVREAATFLDDRAPSADGDRPSWVCVRGDRDVTACLPLTADGLVVGVLAIFRLLPQKGELGPFDRDLLVALAALAGPILQTAQRERSMERR
jgi:GAF domain-containing protein